MPGLCDLPDEVILLTLNCGLFRPADFAAVALSCRRLKNVAEDVLYAQNRDLHGSSAVDWAAEYGNTATLDKALKHGLSIEPVDEEHFSDDEDSSSTPPLPPLPPILPLSPFQTAVENGQDSAVIWFLDHGADITRKISPFCSCHIIESCILHPAICSRHASTALLLISRGAPLEYFSRGVGSMMDNRVTALKEASLFGLDTVVESLIKYHNMNQVFIKRFDMHLPIGVQHALSWAAMTEGNVPLIRKLVHLGADVNWSSTEWESSPLQMAIANGCFDAANALLDLGAGIRPRDFDCNHDEGDDRSELRPEEMVFSPLHDTLASAFSSKTPLRKIYHNNTPGSRTSWKKWHSDRDRFMKRLIELGVDVNMEASGDWGQEEPVITPLGLAVEKENVKDASALLAAGATVSSKMLLTAWHWYEGDDRMEMIRPLLKHGARLDEPIQSDQTMLQLLADDSKTEKSMSGLNEMLLVSSSTNLAREHLSEVFADTLADLDWYTSTVLFRHGARVSDPDKLFAIASIIVENVPRASQYTFPRALEEDLMFSEPGLCDCMRHILDMGLSDEDQCLIFQDILRKKHRILAHLFLDCGIANKPEAIQYLVAYMMLAASWGDVDVINRLWQEAHQYLGPAHRLLIVYNSIIEDEREAVSFFMDHGVTPLDSLSPDESRNAVNLRSEAEEKETKAIRTLKKRSSGALYDPRASRQQKKVLLSIETYGMATIRRSYLHSDMSPLQLAVRYGHMDIIRELLNVIPRNADVSHTLLRIHIPKVFKMADEISNMILKAADPEEIDWSG
ncbi:hypothetical protein KVR01_004832 [Diaporthe batatas]|uniref:uncharacterized protein n=1 Tax=Diaporthe batatas TaxID=748121 RepID=UPI001D058870|nr:uncharacterized protein KVR01_004832 [Diaporthe batatas]KAG8166280.1 hypothetical protein KVR01_004832 [Diaporthe batatas]